MLVPVLLYSQEIDSCKVLMSEISAEYEGDCLNGLADGKGKAIGVDTYEGMFKEGYPEGKGKYTYKNGNVFTGYWLKGIKHGKGKFVFYINGKINLQDGYWDNGDFVGNQNPNEFYRVTGQSGIETYTIKQVKGDEKQIKISFMKSMLKYIPTDLQIQASSGEVRQENKDFYILYYSTPVTCTISFVIRSSMGIRLCKFSFDILKPGKYDVQLINS